MNKHKLDKLFKDKLEGHKISPSPDAWQKLSDRLETNRRFDKINYLKIAAVIVLLIGFTYVMINLTKNRESELVQPNAKNYSLEKSSPKEINPDFDGNDKANETDNTPLITPKNNAPMVVEDGDQQAAAIISAHKNALKPPILRENSAKDLTAKDSKETPESFITRDEMEDTEIKLKTLSVNQADLANTLTFNREDSTETRNPHNDLVNVESMEESRPSVTITFIGGNDEVEKEFMEDLSEEENEKKFSLKTVLALANEINANDGIALLREKKDQLLALDFNKNKRNKSQNKNTHD